MFAWLVDNNLYLMDIFLPKPLVMATINKDTLQIWHSCLVHLGHQNIILVAFLKSYGISLLNADLSVYAKLGLIIAFFVDDLLITGGSISEIKAAKAAFHACFQMSDLGLCKYYLSMTVTRDCKNQILRLGQRAYLEKILFDHQMTDCKPAPIPIKTQYLIAVVEK